MTILSRDYNKIKHVWKDAYAIRSEEVPCPACRKAGRFYSLQLERWPVKNRTSPGGVPIEDCGYYCAYCGWGNAGSRPVDGTVE